MPKVVTEIPKSAKPAGQIVVVQKETAPQDVLEEKSRKALAIGAGNRKIIYPDLRINGVLIPRDNLRITVAMAKEMLGWETEAEYRERRFKKDGCPAGLTKEEYYQYRSPSSTDPLRQQSPEWAFKDPNGEPVVCRRNANNRPIDEGWVDRLTQDILTRCWRFNCETIIISKTRLVESGQHRLVALICAGIIWAGKNSDYWKTFWPEEVPGQCPLYIESLVATGAEETPEVLMTLDNTKARTEADNFFTSDLIDWQRPGPNGTLLPLTSPMKKECAKYLEKAVELLWRRTGAEGQGSFSRYRTHATSMEFIKKHETLMKCVRHVWEENSFEGRAISDIAKSPGEAAAMLYLMGSCSSDGDQYRHHVSAAERSEEGLDWKHLERAKLFWSLLAASDPNVEPGNVEAKRIMKPLRHAFGKIADPEQGAGGGSAERQAIVAKAWALFYDKDGTDMADDDLALRYGEERDPEGNLKSRWLDECPIFGGIDIGTPTKETQTVAPPSPKQTEKNKAEMKKQKDEDLKQKLKESQARIAPTQSEKQKAQLATFKEQNPGKYILVRLPSGAHAAFGSDALVLAKTLGVDVNESVDPIKLAISKADAPEHLAKIAAAHSNVVVVSKKTVPQGQPDQYDVEPLVAAAPEHQEGVPVQGPRGAQ